MTLFTPEPSVETYLNTFPEKYGVNIYSEGTKLFIKGRNGDSCNGLVVQGADFKPIQIPCSDSKTYICEFIMDRKSTLIMK